MSDIDVTKDGSINVEFTPYQLHVVLEVLTKEQDMYSSEYAPERIIEMRTVIQKMFDAFNN